MMSQIFLISIMLMISVIDFRTKRIPDILTYSGILILFIYKLLIDNHSYTSAILLIFSGFIPFFLIWYITKGKLGLGDAKYSAFLALALGLRVWFLMLFLSSFIALVFALFMIKIKKMGRDVQIPYGPFLSAGAVLSLCIAQMEN